MLRRDHGKSGAPGEDGSLLGPADDPGRESTLGEPARATYLNELRVGVDPGLAMSTSEYICDGPPSRGCRELPADRCPVSYPLLSLPEDTRRPASMSVTEISPPGVVSCPSGVPVRAPALGIRSMGRLRCALDESERIRLFELSSL